MTLGESNATNLGIGDAVSATGHSQTDREKPLLV